MAKLNPPESSAEIPASQVELDNLKEVGHFQLIRKLGQGGMGAVFLALDTTLKRNVALKILPREKASNPTLVRRFKAEAANAAQLRHENIVEVYQTGEVDGLLYMALEFVDGTDVHDFVEKRGVFPVKRSIDIIKQVLRALQHAYEQSIVHRDIKPANLLLRRDGTVKLADMGLARVVDESLEAGITRAGTTVGTVDYMSPEQARDSKAADVRSDIYSLGCTWYHMLTGGPPFPSGSLMNKLRAHATSPLPDPRDANPNVPEGVIAVLNRMTAKSADQRYQTPSEVLKDLEGALVNRDAVARQILDALEDDDEATTSTSSGSRRGGASERIAELDATTDDPRKTSARKGKPAETAPPKQTRLADLDATTDDPRKTTARKGVAKPAELDTTADSSKKTTSANRGRARELPEDEPEEDMGYAVRTPVVKRKPEPESEPDYDDSSAPGRDFGFTSRTSELDEGDEELFSASKKRKKNVPDTPEVPLSEFETPSSKTAQAKESEHNDTKSRPRSLPPPGHDTQKDEEEKSGFELTPKMKLGLLAGGGLLLLLAVVFLVQLAQNSGKAVEVAIPLQVNQLATNSTTVVSSPPGNAPNPEQPGDPNDPKVKDILIGRNQELNGGQIQGSPGSMGTTKVGNLSGNQATTASLVFPWTDLPLDVSKLPVLLVRPGENREDMREFSTLEAALKKLPKDGAVIQLAGAGPYFLSETTFSDGKFLQIRGDPTVRSRIGFIPATEAVPLPKLTLNKSSLSLENVDIVVDAEDFPATKPWTWFDVEQGHAFVRNCSFQMKGNRASATTVLRMAGAAPEESVPATENSAPGHTHWLLDRVVTRGATLQAVSIESTAWEGMIRESLLAAYHAPLLNLKITEKSTAGLHCELRGIYSTLHSQSAILTGSAREKVPGPKETTLVWHGALLSAPPQSPGTAMIEFAEWPTAAKGTASNGPLKNLAWITKESACMGFSKWLEIASDANLEVDSPATWKRLWKELDPASVYSATGWPEKRPSDPTQSALTSWSNETVKPSLPPWPEATPLPGVEISLLSVPDLTEAIVPLPPTPPVKVPAFVSAGDEQIDATKQDIGKVLSSQNWKDGTVFHISGFGQRNSSPFTVRDSKWKLVFHQLEGAPFVVVPKMPPLKAGVPPQLQSFITLEGGQLDIEGGTFIVQQNDSTNCPNVFMTVEKGHFRIEGSRLHAMPTAGSRFQTMIRWNPSREPSASAKTISEFGLIRNSLLSGHGLMLSLALPGRGLRLENSAIFSRAQALGLELGHNNGQSPSALEIDHCTFLAPGTLMTVLSQVAPAKEDQPKVKVLPCVCQVRDSVFGTMSNDSGARMSALLMHYQGAIPVTEQIDWREERCGFAAGIKTFLMSTASGAALPAGLPVQNLDENWSRLWGPGHVQNPLAGLDGVLFQENGSTVSTLKPAHLTLHRTAKAVRHGPSGTPIGVNVTFLEPPKSEGTKPNTKRPPVKKTVPSF